MRVIIIHPRIRTDDVTLRDDKCAYKVACISPPAARTNLIYMATNLANEIFSICTSEEKKTQIATKNRNAPCVPRPAHIYNRAIFASTFPRAAQGKHEFDQSGIKGKVFCANVTLNFPVHSATRIPDHFTIF